LKVWIDLSNSPHPLLFAPIARRLEELGHEVGVTARDNAQTAELTLERWPGATIIGDQSPRSRRQKTFVMACRIRALRRWARAFGAHVALSHNSYAQVVAARSLGLRVVTAMDFEGQPANHLAFRLADLVLLPECLRGSQIHRQGATADRTQFYAGFKEQIYLGDFEPDGSVMSAIGVTRGTRPLVVLRTPPSRAIYHHFNNDFFVEVLETLGRDKNIDIIVLPRHQEQQRAITTLKLSNVVVPARAIDARSLMYHADLVIGAGGTMTREAALMELPTYSVFAGRQPAVDRELERQGRLRRLRCADELVPVESRLADPLPVTELHACGASLVDTFVDATVRSASRSAHRLTVSSP
jgi:uncharacterized protein